MQVAQGKDEPATKIIPNLALMKQLQLDGEPEIRRTRRNIAILFGICIVFNVFVLINSMFTNTFYVCLLHNGRYETIAVCLCGIFYFGLGLLAACRYSEIGLRVIGIVGIFQLAMLALSIVGLIGLAFMYKWLESVSNMYSNEYRSSTDQVIRKRMIPIFCIVLYTIDFILMIIMVKLAFKLAGFIGAKKAMTIQQVQYSISNMP
ncbi:unnamed protein product [Rotaria socialis]|uniref:Uncharacterized protein n=1 Tax=Rotaria socialis TaxID=392032 RepID=A0A817MN34_9BILA|nr:unnamed protein product [Rotaria socialis]CAF3404032.1 unnamed protein product [Rotaria socialis]CAF3528188.1 unnamed protein product [Rotaria socialis]CAF3776137.1 unnamed protein product [Rotaria socialis]CAF4262713.1 unnamed protein product [Rotaria socialis]